MATTHEKPNPTAQTLARVDDWLKQLAQETDQARHSEQMHRYFGVLSRFYHYSPTNCHLIAIQCPNATRVAGYHRWRELGRQVRKGAKGIAILCPAPIRGENEDGEKVKLAMRFRVGYVFDLADTDGQDLPSLTWQQVHGERYEHLLARLAQIAGAGGINVTFTQLPNGVQGLSHGGGKVEIAAGDPAGNQCQTLIHEIAHERMHKKEDRHQFTRQQKECQAEAVSYCICQALAIPTPNTPQYLALYHVTKDVLAAHPDTRDTRARHRRHRPVTNKAGVRPTRHAGHQHTPAHQGEHAMSESPTASPAHADDRQDDTRGSNQTTPEQRLRQHMAREGSGATNQHPDGCYYCGSWHHHSQECPEREP